MAEVALFDLLGPYFLAGVDLGAAVHDVLSVLHVDELHGDFDESEPVG